MSIKLTNKVEYCGRSPKKRRAQPPEDILEVGSIISPAITVTPSYNELQTLQEKIAMACDGVTASQVDINKISDSLKERLENIEAELSKKKRRIKSIKVRF